MKILVINAGSSSLKYQLINMENESVIAKGLCERIGIDGSVLTHKTSAGEFVIKNPMPTHVEAIQMVLDALVDANHGVIKSMDEISAVGHRVVHAAEDFNCSQLITDDVMKVIEHNIDLAPLHQPANIMGIKACKKVMPNAPMVAVFDTTFHSTMPDYAYMYGVPYEDYKDYRVRKYGFHGTSHLFVSGVAQQLLGGNKGRIIVCHLGNGASVSAVKDGKCIDTSMGLTPLEGLLMGTRCGDLDPAVLEYLSDKKGMDIHQITTYLNKKSGVLGISGVSNDCRLVEGAAAEGNERAALALKVFAHKVKFYIGAYIAEMNGVDAIVFTAGLGENSGTTRRAICDYLGFLGVHIDSYNNSLRGKALEISATDSRVRVFVIPTNEELVIARDTKELLDK